MNVKEENVDCIGVDIFLFLFEIGTIGRLRVGRFRDKENFDAIIFDGNT